MEILKKLAVIAEEQDCPLCPVLRFWFLDKIIKTQLIETANVPAAMVVLAI